MTGREFTAAAVLTLQSVATLLVGIAAALSALEGAASGEITSQASADAARSDNEPAPPDDSATLIGLLGSDDYGVRSRAEEALIRRGAAAFDELKRAADHTDLEIAERANYILHQIDIEWIRSGDSPAAAAILVGYSDLAEEDRLDRIIRLGKLSGPAGVAPLCRIARFESSALLSRRAAVAVLEFDWEQADPVASEVVSSACQRELGPSERTAAQWLRLFARERRSPAAVAQPWSDAVDAEIELLQQDADETSASIALALLRHQLQLCDRLQLSNAIDAALRQIIEISGSKRRQRIAGLYYTLRLIIDEQMWHVLARLEQSDDRLLREDRNLLYHLAVAYVRQGRMQLAEQTAQAAYELSADDATQRVNVADAVAGLGRIEWAEREYRYVIANAPATDLASIEARNDLSMWLHDREDHLGASQVLGEMCDALDQDDEAKQSLIKSIDRRFGSGFGIEYLNRSYARRQFYLAHHLQAQGDYSQQKASLLKAAKYNERDPDVLIAMYHAKNADDAFRARTAALLERVNRYQQVMVDELPEDPAVYNQWAWLVSNTEGDFDKAVRYSKKSLELAPGEPSYLDTLARCYYAAGNLEEAVKQQRRAVRLQPFMQVMQRQLKFFEREFAKANEGAEAPLDVLSDEDRAAQ